MFSPSEMPQLYFHARMRMPYDAFCRRDRVTSVSNGCGVASQVLGHTYDALSRPTTRNADAFAYNERGEVVFSRRDAEGAEDTYAYDDIGNLQIAAVDSVTNTYTANSLNQYTCIHHAPTSSREISHDLDGNHTNDCAFAYSYDSENRLSSLSSNGITLVANQYDYRGRRIRKTTSTAETTFVYDGWNLVYECEVVGDVTNETFYCWGKDLSGTLQGAGGVGGLLYLKHNGTIYVPHTDACGNVVRYTDTVGSVVAEYTYDAFGKTIAQSGSMADIFRHRFSTKYYAHETGLYYYGYRFYSPSLMRWLNRDPIEETGGVNLYGFCGNNAICKYDKDGRAHFEVRRLSSLPAILGYSCFAQIIGAVPALILDLGLADKLNIEMLHEHLFYDDGSNVGYGSEGFMRNESRKGYIRRDFREYDDCIMHEAEDRVAVPPYSLIGIGVPKYNCQDYADALRRKYDSIKDNKAIQKKCCCRKEK